MKAGVLALQGDFREHAAAFRDLAVSVREVRTPAELAEVDCLAIPGGESTTMAKLARSAELVEPLRERIDAGMPILGTCAGMIVLAKRVDDDDGLLGALDIAVRRNAYGRQTESFEADVDVRGTGSVRAVFIRAPVVESVGEGVDVLGEHEGHAVVLECGNVLVASFHPELVGETALHARLLERV
ncbi:MAG: pyridoxal 5'-phosphate synthase glutaminase subunit PdxT [Actinomycetota bacterium]